MQVRDTAREVGQQRRRAHVVRRRAQRRRRVRAAGVHRPVERPRDALANDVECQAVTTVLCPARRGQQGDLRHRVRRVQVHDVGRRARAISRKSPGAIDVARTVRGADAGHGHAVDHFVHGRPVGCSPRAPRRRPRGGADRTGASNTSPCRRDTADRTFQPAGPEPLARSHDVPSRRERDRAAVHDGVRGLDLGLRARFACPA